MSLVALPSRVGSSCVLFRGKGAWVEDLWATGAGEMHAR